MRTLVLLALAVAPSVALAQASPQPSPPGALAAAPPTVEEGVPVTFDEVMKAARDYNRDIRAAREHLVQADADIDRAWAALLPTVLVQGKYTHNNIEAKLDTSAYSAFGDALVDLYTKTNTAPSPSVLQGLTALQGQQSGPIIIQKGEQLDFIANANIPLVNFANWWQLRAARKAFAAQKAGYDATEAGLLLQVAAAFYGAAGTDEMALARRHAIEVAQKTLSDAEVRFQAGVVNRVEVARAKVALLRAEQALREALDGTAAAYRSLRTLTGLTGPIRVLAPEEPAAAETDTGTLVADALRLRPEIMALDRQIAAATDSATSNKLRWLPSLSGFGLFRAFNYKGFYPDYYAWSVGLQLDWLLYDGGFRQAGAKQFQSVVRESRLRLDQLRHQIADEVANLRDQLATKRRGLQTAREEKKLAEETLELVRVQREAGTATQLDLLTAQDQLVLTELNVARLRFDLGLTNLQLLRAIGQFPGSGQ